MEYTVVVDDWRIWIMDDNDRELFELTMSENGRLWVSVDDDPADSDPEREVKNRRVKTITPRDTPAGRSFPAKLKLETHGGVGA